MNWRLVFSGFILILCFGCAQKMNAEEALEIAKNSECADYQLLPHESYYNNNTNTWKIIIDKTGPAACMYWCEVYQNQTAKVKMMCSGV